MVVKGLISIFISLFLKIMVNSINLKIQIQWSDNILYQLVWFLAFMPFRVLNYLSVHGVDQHVLKWFNSHLTNRRQRCSVNNHLCSTGYLNCGVFQGSIVGPLFFMMYINDSSNSMSSGYPRMSADDMTLMLRLPHLKWLISTSKSMVN